MTIDSQLRFREHAKEAKKKLSSQNNIKELSGKNWGLREADLRRLYKTNVRPGGTYAMELCGPIASETQFKCLETTNNTAARIIKGLPRGSLTPQTFAESQLTTLQQECEDGAAKLYEHSLNRDRNHTLHQLASKASRPRLKSREGNFRGDRISTAKKRMAPVQSRQNVSEHINLTREDNKLHRYPEVSKDFWHYTPSQGGYPLPVNSDPSRESQVKLNQLRVNSATWLQHTKQFGRSDSSIFGNCTTQSDEDANPFLPQCLKLASERQQTIGGRQTPDILQSNPDDVKLHIFEPSE